jgi:phospholipid/cholesterol/gamma-HCH transport system substrate-binding protein
MRIDKKTEIKVGIFTILSLIVFIWIMGWAKNFMRSSTDIEINVMFDNVSGLEIDDEVTVRGLRKGFVKDIFLDRNIILVKISIDESVDLRKDAEFSLATLDLMGGKKVEILPGISPDPLQLDVLHRGTFVPDLSSMMATIGSMKEDLMTIVNDIKISLSAINTYLSDDDIKYDLKSSLKNLNSLTSQIDGMLIENMDNISTITENTAALSEDARTFFDTNQENLSTSISRLKSLLTDSDSLVNKFNYLTSETMEGKNNLGKIIYDDSLMINITETLDKLNQLTKIILFQMQADGVKVDANIW